MAEVDSRVKRLVESSSGSLAKCGSWPSISPTGVDQPCFSVTRAPYNRFPLIINDVPPPHPVIINNPGGQKLFIIRGACLLKGLSRAAFKILLKSIRIESKSR